MRYGLLGFALLFFACRGDTVQSTIGPAGGTVTGDGISLVVPPGALATEVEILIQTIDVPDGYVAVGNRAFRFSPAGLMFSLPLTVSFDAAPEESAQIYWSLSGSDELVPLATTYAGGRASALVTHFSIGLSGWEGSSGDAAGNDAGNDAGNARIICVQELAPAGAPGAPCGGHVSTMSVAEFFVSWTLGEGCRIASTNEALNAYFLLAPGDTTYWEEGVSDGYTLTRDVDEVTFESTFMRLGSCFDGGFVIRVTCSGTGSLDNSEPECFGF